MAIPVSIEKLLNGNVVEWARIEFNDDVNQLFKSLCFENAKKYKGYFEQISLF